MKILVAEDDAVTRKILAVTLERLGWDVVTAKDGDEVWRIFEALKGNCAPELAVVDWMMPGAEGVEICRRLRATPGFEFVYVILLTSRGTNRICRKASPPAPTITSPSHSTPWSLNAAIAILRPRLVALAGAP